MLKGLSYKYRPCKKLKISYLDFHVPHSSSDDKDLLIVNAEEFIFNNSTRSCLLHAPRFYNAVSRVLTDLRVL